MQFASFEWSKRKGSRGGRGYPRFRLAIRQQLAKITVFFVCCCCYCWSCAILLKRGRGVAFSAKQLNDAVDALINKADKQQEEEDHTKGTYTVRLLQVGSPYLPNPLQCCSPTATAAYATHFHLYLSFFCFCVFCFMPFGHFFVLPINFRNAFLTYLTLP